MASRTPDKETVSELTTARLSVYLRSLTYLESIGHGGHSSQFNLALMKALPVSDRFALSLSAGATWSDRNYMQTYFGVTAQQSVASGFAVYTPKAGLQRVDVGVGAEFKLSASLKLKTQLGGSRLCRIAERVPARFLLVARWKKSLERALITG